MSDKKPTPKQQVKNMIKSLPKDQRPPTPAKAQKNMEKFIASLDKK